MYKPARAVTFAAIASIALATGDHEVFAVVVGLSGEPGTQTGFPLIMDGGEGHIARNYEAGYGLCDGGGMRNQMLTIGWTAHLVRTPGGAVHYLVQASRLAHPEQLESKTCFHTPPELVVARWEGDTSAGPGEVVELKATQGFEGTLEHLRDTASSH